MRSLKKNEIYVIKVWVRKAFTNLADNYALPTLIGIYTDLGPAAILALKAAESQGYKSVTTQRTTNIVQFITPETRTGKAPVATITIEQLNSLIFDTEF